MVIVSTYKLRWAFPKWVSRLNFKLIVIKHSHSFSIWAQYFHSHRMSTIFPIVERFSCFHSSPAEWVLSCSIKSSFSSTRWIFTQISLVIGFALLCFPLLKYISLTYRDIPEDVLNTYCWIHSTYTVVDAFMKKQGLEVPFPGIDNSQGGRGPLTIKHNKYYQWVAFTLFFQVSFRQYLLRYIYKIIIILLKKTQLDRYRIAYGIHLNLINCGKRKSTKNFN